VACSKKLMFEYKFEFRRSLIDFLSFFKDWFAAQFNIIFGFVVLIS
jgi:hypothetical protein